MLSVCAGRGVGLGVITGVGVTVAGESLGSAETSLPGSCETIGDGVAEVFGVGVAVLTSLLRQAQRDVIKHTILTQSTVGFFINRLLFNINK